jgi:hypothetical protein
MFQVDSSVSGGETILALETIMSVLYRVGKLINCQHLCYW